MIFHKNFLETLINGEQVVQLNKDVSSNTIDAFTNLSVESQLTPWNPDNMFIKDQES